MISIIMPTWNRKDMLLEAIDSIDMQTFTEWELVIVDDCSTDDTQETVRNLMETDPRIRYYQNKKNMGPGCNRGFGFLKSHGDYVIFMDDDDIYTDPEFFQKAMDVYGADTDGSLALVAANAYKCLIPEKKRITGNIGVTGRISGVGFMAGFGVKYKKPYSTFPAVFRRSALEEAELASSDMVNDYCIYLRGLLYGDAYILKDCVGDYRIHEGSISHRITKDFLIKNIQERIWVREKLLTMRKPSFVRRWWDTQMLILAKYYYLGSNPKKTDARETAKYILQNSHFSPVLYTIIPVLSAAYRPLNAIRGGKKEGN